MVDNSQNVRAAGIPIIITIGIIAGLVMAHTELAAAWQRCSNDMVSKALFIVCLALIIPGWFLLLSAGWAYGALSIALGAMCALSITWAKTRPKVAVLVLLLWLGTMTGIPGILGSGALSSISGGGTCRGFYGSGSVGDNMCKSGLEAFVQLCSVFIIGALALVTLPVMGWVGTPSQEPVSSSPPPKEVYAPPTGVQQMEYHEAN